MKFFFALGLVLLNLSCSNKSSDAGPTADPIFGTWTYVSPNSTSSSIRGYATTIDANGNILFMQIYGYSDSASAKLYVRKNIGTYVRNGEVFDIKWSHETCNPVGSETVKIKSLSLDSLVASLSKDTIQLSFSRAVTSDPVKNLAIIEDVNCTILTKLEGFGKTKRAVASVIGKSFFDQSSLK
jgi:hypothetical protein